MRILYIVRLFSGLEASVKERRWRPTGVPTIYRVLEKLSVATTLDVVLAAKSDKAWPCSGATAVEIDGLDARVCVLGAPSIARHLPRKLAVAAREIGQILSILRRAWRSDADMIYIDHGNVLAAALLARFGRRPVVLRLMGVYPAMRAALNGRRPAHQALRWAYRTRYAHIVMTQDGSGVERWIDSALHPETPVSVWLNGIDPAFRAPARSTGLKTPITVCFVGKLEWGKGADRFVEAMLRVRAARPGQCRATLIGAGPLKSKIEAMISGAEAEADIQLIERLPHAEVAAALRDAEIYVSLNRFGNLSNANLEAFSAGAATIMPDSQLASGVDVVTDTLIPKNAVTRVPSTDDVAAIADTIIALVDAPERARSQGEALRRFAADAIPAWDARVDQEIALLYAIADTPWSR